jgi:hypothetical protein
MNPFFAFPGVVGPNVHRIRREQHARFDDREDGDRTSQRQGMRQRIAVRHRVDQHGRYVTVSGRTNIDSLLVYFHTPIYAPIH